MAEKAVFNIEVYPSAGAGQVNFKVEIRYAQNGVSNLYCNGVAIILGRVGDFEKELNVTRGDKVKIVTTVSDIISQTDNTGVDVTITGGVSPLVDQQNMVADTNDLVTYDLTYYIQ